MYRSSSPWQAQCEKDQSKTISITKERIRKQLTAVIELTGCNAQYLEQFEVDWISHVTSNAAQYCHEANEVLTTSLQPERAVETNVRLSSKFSFDVPRSRRSKQTETSSEEELSKLLGITKSLNSVTSLLSCCYERWCWTSSTSSWERVNSKSSDELRELLQWKRPRPESSDRTSTGEPRIDLTTGGHKVVLPHTEANLEPTQTWLSLLADTTTEKWRQNAEDALNAATARSAGAVPSSPQFLLQNSSLHASANVQHDSNADSEQHISSRLADTRKDNERLSENQPSCIYPLHAAPVERQCTSCSRTRPSLFHQSLQNSFDKEPLHGLNLRIIAEEHNDSTDTIQTHPNAAVTYQPALEHMLSRSTFATESDSLELSSTSSIAPNVNILSSVNQSVTSLQSTAPSSRRSRGREWLENQSQLSEPDPRARRKYEYN